MVTPEEKFAYRYKLQYIFSRSHRYFRKLFYERWQKSHGVRYLEIPLNGTFIKQSTVFKFQLSEISAAKIVSGRVVDWDYHTLVHILLLYPWKNIDRATLQRENEVVERLCGGMYTGFYNNHDKKTENHKARPCSDGCTHTESFEDWSHTTKLFKVISEIATQIDKTMNESDWNKLLNSYSNNDDNYQPKPLYNLDDMEQSTFMKKFVEDHYNNQRYMTAIHFADLTLELQRGVSEFQLASLYELKARCWLEYVMYKSIKMKEYVKKIKRNIEAALCIRPCHAESYAILASYYTLVGKYHYARYLYNHALRLKNGDSKKYKSMLELSEKLSKQKTQDETISSEDFMEFMPRIMGQGLMMTKYHTEAIQTMTKQEADTFMLIQKAKSLEGHHNGYHIIEEDKDFEKKSSSLLGAKPDDAFNLYEKLATDNKQNAEVLFRMARIMLTQKNDKQKSIEYLKKAAKKPFALKTGQSLNECVGAANYHLAQLTKENDPKGSEKLYYKAIECDDKKYCGKNSAYELGNLYLKGFTSPKDEFKKIPQDIEKGLFMLRIANLLGHPNAANIVYQYYLSTTGEKSTKTVEWRSRAQIKADRDTSIPIAYPPILEEFRKQTKDQRSKDRITTFRNLLVKFNNAPVTIPKNPKPFYKSLPDNHIPKNEFKVVDQSSLDEASGNPLAGLGLDMPIIYEKCMLVGFLREEPLVSGNNVELLFDDLKFVPIRIIADGYDPTKFKVGQQYAFISFRTAKSFFDGEKIHSCDYISEGVKVDRPCRNCMKPSKSTCSICKTPFYCDRECQVYDFKTLQHKLTCGLKSLNDRL